MEIINEPTFRKQIKSAPGSGYLFFGDEDYLKAHALKTAREALCPDEALAPFNNMRMEGLDFDVDALLPALSTFPMMSDRKLIEITGLDFNAMKQSELDTLCETLSQLGDYEYNTVIISAAAGAINEGYLPNRPSALLKKLAEHLTPVQFARSDRSMLIRWSVRHFAANGVIAPTGLCEKLTDYCGQDMYRLSSEIDKLSWYTLSHGNDTVSENDIEKAAIADTSYDSFAFANAVTDGRQRDALNILGEMKRRRIEPTYIMSEIIRVFCDMLTVRMLADDGLGTAEIAKLSKLHEYRVKLFLRASAGKEKLRTALSRCVEADAALKLSPQGYTALEKLICSL